MPRLSPFPSWPRPGGPHNPYPDPTKSVSSTPVIVFLIVIAIIGLLFLEAHLYHLWPFSLLTTRLSLRLPRFRGWGLEKRKEETQPQRWSDELGSEVCASNRLCAACRRAVNRSGLIFGRFWIVTPKSEFTNLHSSLSDLQASSRELCHLCGLLWHAIPREMRQSIFHEDQILKEQIEHDLNEHLERDGSIASAEKAQKSVRKKMRIRLKIFDEVPLSRTYFDWLRPIPLCMQVYRGDYPVSEKLEILKASRVDNEQTEFTTTTDTKYHLELAQKWIGECTSKHKRCQLQRDANAPFPTRLVYVGEEGNWDILRLYVTSSEDHGKPYAALSHCWGAASIFTLNNQTMSSMLDSIPFASLARNFRDAIVITRRLGLSYIWVDSLCILQDSTADWASESTIMDSIYSNAFVTIAATGSASSSGGCFHTRNPLSLYPYTIASSRTYRLVVAPSISGSAIFDEIDESPLNQRAWVFQERLLSQRILHFGSNLLLWECRQLTASEFDVVGTKYRYLRNEEPRYKRQKPTERQQRELNRVCVVFGTVDERTALLREQPHSSLQELSWRRLHGAFESGLSSYYWREPQVPWGDVWIGYRGAFETLTMTHVPAAVGERLAHRSPFANMLGFHLRWFELVRLYTSGRLTKPQDKLVAIAGVARKVRRARQLTYLAGLWKEYLLLNLLWNLEFPAKSRPDDYRAPTWSWAAVDGQIRHSLHPGYELVPQSSQAVIQETQVTTDGSFAPDTANLIDSGFIRVEGAMCAISKVEYFAKRLFLLDNRGNFIAWLLPDVIMREPYPKLYCLKIASFTKKNAGYDKIEIQGLVVTMKAKDIYERVGFFSTSVEEWNVHLAFDVFEMCSSSSIVIV